jgi:hypothetical protein
VEETLLFIAASAKNVFRVPQGNRFSDSVAGDGTRPTCLVYEQNSESCQRDGFIMFRTPAGVSRSRYSTPSGQVTFAGGRTLKSVYDQREGGARYSCLYGEADRESGRQLATARHATSCERQILRDLAVSDVKG